MAPLSNDQTYQAALSRLIVPAIIDSQQFRKRKVAIDFSLIDSELLIWAQAFCSEAERLGIPLFINEGYRDAKRQAELRAKGNSRAGPGQSAHQYGMAVDIVHFGFFWELSKKEWTVLGQLGKEVARKRGIDLLWGGDFRSLYDPAHWELADWRVRVAKT